MFGRTKILCDKSEITEANVVEILTNALNTHNKNSNQIDRLYRYYKGDQPVLRRVKEIRPEICNRIVENRAYEAVSFKTGYLCGEPIQYVSRGSTDDVSDEIGKLNDMMLLCGKPAKDKEIAEWMYICGTGYRMVTPNSPYIKSSIVPKLMRRKVSFMEDESPFDIHTLDPRNTFIIYHSGLGEKPLVGVKYVIRKDKKTVYSAYTSTHYFELVSEDNGDMLLSKYEKRALGAIPIIEYPLNKTRQGVVEIVESILNAINDVQSNRLDGVEQFIQSLIVLYNAEIDDGQAKNLRDAGLIILKSFGENKADIKEMNAQLDQQQTQTLIDYLHQSYLEIVGMPTTTKGGASTSDTGSAVIMRDGWSTADARIKSDESSFESSEYQALKIVLSIIRDTVGTQLKLVDVGIKFTRRNYENIQSKTQVFVSLMQSGYCSLEEAYAISGISPDPADSAKKGEEWNRKIKAEYEDELNNAILGES